MLYIRQTFMDILCPPGDTTQEGGPSGPTTARYTLVGNIAREYLTRNAVEGMATQDLVEALFPLKWVDDDRSKLTRDRIFKALLRGATRQLQDCCTQAGQANKFGRKPYRWHKPVADPVCRTDPALHTCPNCGTVFIPSREGL